MMKAAVQCVCFLIGCFLLTACDPAAIRKVEIECVSADARERVIKSITELLHENGFALNPGDVSAGASESLIFEKAVEDKGRPVPLRCTVQSGNGDGAVIQLQLVQWIISSFSKEALETLEDFSERLMKSKDVKAISIMR